MQVLSFKPMLAGKLEEHDFEDLTLPLVVSPKLDGIRCLITEQGAVSRNLKPIPNLEVQSAAKHLPVGLDGELVIPGESFCDVSSVVMGRAADPEGLQYWVFDYFADPLQPFSARSAEAHQLVKTYGQHWVFFVPQITAHSLTKITDLEQRWLSAGYEGIILRDPEAPYKYGRSTLRERGLLKFKRFEDSEARIVGVTPLEHNTNEQRRDELGRAKRSSAKAGKVALQKLGTLQVVDNKTGVHFEIGGGFTDAQRCWLWSRRRRLIGMLVKYKHQASGAKTKPRFPVFLGFRDSCDL